MASEQGTAGKPSIPLDLKTFPQDFTRSDSVGKIQILNTLNRSGLSALAPQAPGFLSNEKNPDVCALIIRKFSPFWPGESIDVLAERIIGRYLNVRLAALEALIQLAPKELVSSLPKLLVSKDPRLSALGIQGLAKIDLQEALRHLEVILLKGNKIQKLAGVQCALLLPFQHVKPILLKILAAEGDQEILHRLGLIFQTNPDPEVPYRLWEVAETSSETKSEIIKSILSNALNVLDRAKILSEPFFDYYNRLQTWLNKRELLRSLQEFSVGALESDTGLAEEYYSRLLPTIEKPGVKEGLQEALSGKFPAFVLAIVKKLLARDAVPESVRDPSREPIREKEKTETQVPVWDASAPIPQKIRTLVNWPEKFGTHIKPVLEALLESEKTLASLRIAALRCAGRLGFVDFAESARKWLKNLDISLTLASLEYLACFTPDDLLGDLVHFIKRGEIRQKVVALKIMRAHFPGRAEHLLMGLLKDENPKNHEAAITALVCVDFPLIRDALTEFLEANPGTELFEAAVFYFQTNPEFENLYCLFKIEKAAKNERRDHVQETRKNLEALLVELNRLNPALIPEFEGEFQARWKSERARKADLPEYSVDVLKKK